MRPSNHINTITTITTTDTMAQQPPTGAAAQNRTIAQVRGDKDRLDALFQQSKRQIAKSGLKGYTEEDMAELEETVEELKQVDALIFSKESALEQQKRVLEAATAGRFNVPREAVPDISQPTKRAWMKLLERSVHKGPDFLRRLVEAIESEDPGLLGTHAAALAPQAPADEHDERSSNVGPVEYEYQVAIDDLNKRVEALVKELHEANNSLDTQTSTYREVKSKKDKLIATLREEVRNLSDRADELKGQVENRDESIMSLNITIAEMVETKKEAAKQMAKTNTELSEANEQLAEAGAKAEAANNDIQNLKGQVAEQQSQLKESAQSAITLRQDADAATAGRQNVEDIIKGLLRGMSLGPTDPGNVASRLLEGNATRVILPPVGECWPIYYDPEGAPGVHVTFQTLAIRLLTLSSSGSLGRENICGILSMMRDGLMRHRSTVLDSVLQLFTSAIPELAEAFQQANIHYPAWLILSQISGLLALSRPEDRTTTALDTKMEELDPLVASLAKTVRSPGRLDGLSDPWESAYFPEHDITLVGCREVMPGMLAMEEGLQRMIWVPWESVMERQGYSYPVVIKRRGGEPWTLNLEYGGMVFALYNFPPAK